MRWASAFRQRLLAFSLVMFLPLCAWSQTRVHSEDPIITRTFTEITKQFRDELRGAFPFVSEGPLDLYTVTNAKEMQRLSKALKLSNPPNWAFGVCWPSRRVIMLRLDGPMEVLRHTLLHEIVHLEFGVGLAASKTPLWFSEGVAQLLERGIKLQRPPLSQQRRGWGEAIALSELTNRFPHWGSQAQRAYAQSEAMVWYLYDEVGHERFVKLLAELQAQSASFNEAFQTAYGGTIDEFESRFLETSQFNQWWHELFRDYTLLGFAGILLAIAGIRSRLQQRKRLTAMKYREALEDE